jgi:hypothetical protein
LSYFVWFNFVVLLLLLRKLINTKKWIYGVVHADYTEMLAFSQMILYPTSMYLLLDAELVKIAVYSPLVLLVSLHAYHHAPFPPSSSPSSISSIINSASNPSTARDA